MSSSDDTSLRLEQGLVLTAQRDGLRIRVVDYHAGDVVVTWEALQRLRLARPPDVDPVSEPEPGVAEPDGKTEDGQE